MRVCTLVWSARCRERSSTISQHRAALGKVTSECVHSQPFTPCVDAEAVGWEGNGPHTSAGPQAACVPVHWGLVASLLRAALLFSAVTFKFLIYFYFCSIAVVPPFFPLLPPAPPTTLFFFLIKILFIFKERKRGRKRAREISVWKTSIGCLSHAPYWVPGLQPRHVPWLGIKLAILRFVGRCPAHRTHYPGPLPCAIGASLHLHKVQLMWFHLTPGR